MCPSHAFWRNVKTPKISANFLGRPGVQWACFAPTWPTRKSDVCFCLKAILSEFANLCPVLWIFWGITIQVNSNLIFIEVASYKKRLLLMYRKIPFPDSAVPQAANFANYAQKLSLQKFCKVNEKFHLLVAGGQLEQLLWWKVLQQKRIKIQEIKTRSLKRK